jgi:uncharacterized membrane protein YphA (DoxX/SURF4 family)
MKRATISLATIVLLVVLRINIGWHFFKEGVNHHADRNWSSEGFLRLAKGPLAPTFQAYLPDVHRWNELLHSSSFKPEEAVKSWITQVKDDWDQSHGQFNLHYGLEAAQKERTKQIVQDFKARLDDWAAATHDELVDYAHQWQRTYRAQAQPWGQELPFQKQRIAAAQAREKAAAADLLAQELSLEDELVQELSTVLTAEQRGKGSPPAPKSPLAAVDRVMTYGILAIGVCLMVGLFTRLAAVLGAGFLVSVVLTQPFWITDAQPTFNQWGEMIALLVLATTHVGRWCGLDFFVHNFLVRPCCGAERNAHASHT